mgnify:CR=1 FL=1
MEHPLKQRPEIYKDYEDLVKSFIVYSITKSESDKESLTELCKTILYNKLNSNQEEQDFYSLFFIDGSGYINMPLDIANMVPDVTPEQMLSKIDLLTIRLRGELEKEHGTLNRDIGYLTGVDEVNVNNVKEVNEKLAAKLTSPVDTNVSNQGSQPKTQGDSKMNTDIKVTQPKEVEVNGKTYLEINVNGVTSLIEKIEVAKVIDAEKAKAKADTKATDEKVDDANNVEVQSTTTVTQVDDDSIDWMFWGKVALGVIAAGAVIYFGAKYLSSESEVVYVDVNNI